MRGEGCAPAIMYNCIIISGKREELDEARGAGTTPGGPRRLPSLPIVSAETEDERDKRILRPQSYMREMYSFSAISSTQLRSCISSVRDILNAESLERWKLRLTRIKPPSFSTCVSSRSELVLALPTIQILAFAHHRL